MINGFKIAFIASFLYFAETTSLAPQTEQQTSPFTTLGPIPITTGQIGNIRVIRQSLCNLLPSIDTTNLNQATTSLCNSLADDIGTFGLTLRADNVSLTLLFGTLDDEPSPFGILLGDLLLFDGSSELLAEGHVGDGDIFQGDVELRRTLQQVAPDPVRDSFSLCDEFCGVELGHDSFQDFVADGWENTLVVVCAVGL